VLTKGRKPKAGKKVWTDPLLIWAVARLPLLALVLAIFSDAFINVLPACRTWAREAMETPTDF
jgi:hypothetical protein